MRIWLRVLAAVAASCFTLGPWGNLPARAEALEAAETLQGGIFNKVISVSVSNLALGDAIRLVAAKGDLNVMVANGLDTRVNLALNGVTLGDALRTLFAIGGLEAFSSGKVMVILPRDMALKKGLIAQSATLIPLRYASSQAIADFLNTSALASPYAAAGSSFKFAQADLFSNSVLIMAAPADIKVAERIVASLDRLQERRVYRLNHANALQVAEILNATLFNNGNKAAGGSSLDVEGESTTDGAAQTAAGGSSAELSTSGGQIRSTTLKPQTLSVAAMEPQAVPDSRDNSVIVMGSHDILAQADQLIAQLDRPSQQVAIAVQILEISTRDASDLGLTFGGGINSVVDAGFDPTNATLPGIRAVYNSTTTVAKNLTASLHALLSNNRAKLLAHPTVIASDNTESEIDIVNDVIKGVQVSTQGSGNATFAVQTPIFGVAGIVLDILPQIGTDGSVTLRLHPTVSTVSGTQVFSGNTVSLLSRRELLTQKVTLQSGSTLVLGGLTQTNKVEDKSKWPLLGDIPFLGTLFSTTTTSDDDTELVISVTPKILPAK